MKREGGEWSTETTGCDAVSFIARYGGHNIVGRTLSHDSKLTTRKDWKQNHTENLFLNSVQLPKHFGKKVNYKTVPISLYICKSDLRCNLIKELVTTVLIKALIPLVQNLKKKFVNQVVSSLQENMSPCLLTNLEIRQLTFK